MSHGATTATASALTDDDLKSYQSLFATSSERRRGMFTRLQQTDAPGAIYLGQWRRSMVGCC
jgi:hypothetical protein